MKTRKSCHSPFFFHSNIYKWKACDTTWHTIPWHDTTWHSLLCREFLFSALQTLTATCRSTQTCNRVTSHHSWSLILPHTVKNWPKTYQMSLLTFLQHIVTLTEFTRYYWDRFPGRIWYPMIPWTRKILARLIVILNLFPIIIDIYNW